MQQTPIEKIEYELLKLKGSFYDRLAQIEYHQVQINELSKQNSNINSKITIAFNELNKLKQTEALNKVDDKALQDAFSKEETKEELVKEILDKKEKVVEDKS